MATADHSERLKRLSPAKRALLLQAIRAEAAQSEAARSIPRRLEDGPVPLSFAQQRLWFLDQLAPGSPVYNLSTAIRLTGRLDLAAFERSLNEVVQRHEALRTTFAEIDGQPVQMIAPAGALPPPVIDLGGLPAPEREREAVRCATAEALRPFDLTRGPLLRAALLRLDATEHVLLLNMHHIVSDGWSLGVLTREITTLYAAFVAGQPAPLPALPIQYADFAIWQRAWLQGQDEHGESPLQKQLAYWQGQLDGSPPMLDLPTDRRRPATQSYRGAARPLALSQPLSAALAALSRRAGATLFMTLLAAFKVLLYRYTGQPDIVAGSPIANRNRPELEGLIGFFVNTLVMRTDLSGTPSFQEVLRRVSETTLGAYAHQDLPFERLVEALQPVRDPSRHPLFQVVFVLQNAAMPPLELAGLVLAPLVLDSEMTKFDLSLSMEEAPTGLQGALHYNTDLFDEATIARMLGHFQTLLEGIVADPERRISDMPLLTPAERHLLSAWSDPQTDYPRDGCIHQLFAAQAARTPDAVALVGGAAHLTYAELDRKANQLACYLRSRGVGPEVCVTLCLERSPDLVIGILAILKAGSAYVPLDPAWPAERLAFILAETQAPILLTHQALYDRLPASAERICLDTLWPTLPPCTAAPPGSAVSPDQLAYVMYTSGSTGRPKGVAAIHRGVVRLVQQTNYAVFGPQEVFLLLAPMAFDAATFELWGALLNGARLVVFPSDLPALADLGTMLRREQITSLWLTAGLFQQMVDADPAALLALRQLLAGGDVLPLAHVRRVLRAGGRVRLINGYGPTENTTFTCCHPIPADLPDDVPGVPIGRPIANTSVYVLDRQLLPVPIGVPGELYIGGAGLARGYLGRPDLTAERFVPNPFADQRLEIRDWRLSGTEASISNLQSLISSGTRLYKTGDLARWLPDGTIEFLGRIDQQVKLRGFRVEPGEIEVVLQQHPAVHAAAVVVREDRPGDRRLVAYIVMRDWRLEIRDYDSDNLQSPISNLQPELRAFLAERLPEYMIPSAFVPLDALPLTPNGKVDRRALPAPERVRADGAAGAPRSGLERTLAAIWRELLQLDQVGIHDNFFDLGGHSLLLIQLQHRLHNQLGRDLPIVELFHHPTIAALAASLDQDAPALVMPTPRAPDTPLATVGIAIVGMAGRFPGAPDLAAFWANLAAGVESIHFFSEDELRAAGVAEALLRDPHYVRAGTVLEDAEAFDAALFGYAPREALLLDPQQRVLLECAWSALEDAGYDPARYPGAIGVYAGAAPSSHLLALYTTAGAVQPDEGFQVQLGNTNDHLATRLAYKLNLRGPALTVQTACSTSLVALHLAAQALLRGECDLALAGGVAIQVPQTQGYHYHVGRIASPDGHCRAFDAQAAGTVKGNGAGVVVLKRLDAALAGGDRIYAVIRGSAINNDGAQKVGYTAPSVEGQAAVIATAQAAAGVDPATIGYIEAHGSGTALGDPIEVAALTQAFGPHAAARGICAIGSVKTNVGHLDAAAGIVGLIKTVLALQHRQIPPSLHFETPNPQIDFTNSPFYVNTTLSGWPENGHPRRAGVSAFGMGGTNAHVVLEEAPAPAASGPARPWQLLVLSARTETALATAGGNLAAFLRQNPGLNLADVAYTLQTGRRAFRQRQVLVCAGLEEAIGALETRDPQRVLIGCATDSEPSVVFMFPGLGAQYLQMGRELYATEPIFREHVDHCAELLRPLLGCDLRDMIYPGAAAAPPSPTGALPERDLRALLGRAAAPDPAAATLDQTRLAQPALFVIAYALAQLWIAWGVRPRALLGYSIGEYVAACLAGVFSLEDALTLVVRRTQLIDALPAGAMLAVALGEAELAPLLGDQLSLTGINGPSLCIVGGPPAAVGALEQLLTARGVANRRVRTTHAFHSRMMAPIREAYARLVQDFALEPPRIPYLSNVTGTWISAAEATDPNYWAAHLCEPVRFAESVAQLWQLPDPVLLEVGPEQGLGSLALQHPASKGLGDAVVVSSLRPAYERQSDQAFLLQSLGRLWLAGVPVDWAGLYAGERRLRVSLPAYPFERQRYWIEPQPAAHDGGSKPAAPGKHADIADWFYLPSWRLAPAPRGPEPGTTECWLVFDDGRVGRQIVQRLEQQGREVIRVRAGEHFLRQSERAFTLNPERSADYESLCKALRTLGKAPNLIVHCWSLTQDDRHPQGEAFFQPAQDAGYYSLLFLCHGLERASMSAPLRIAVVSNHLHCVTDSEIAYPEKMTLMGPCKAIPQEYPNITCRCIDIVLPEAGTPRAADLAERLIAESRLNAPDRVIAYRGKQRWVQTFEPLRLEAQAEPLRQVRQRGVYLIAGGLGTVGLLLAEHLARTAQARLVLVGRSGLPPRETWAERAATDDPGDPVSAKIRKVLALEDLGAEVLVLGADVADEAQMRAAIDQTYARFGALHGVLHGAVTPGRSLNSPIGAIHRGESEAQFQPKVYGLYVLEKLLQGRPLDFCLLLSSNSAVLGGLGLLAYSAANLFMDAFAAYKTRTGDIPWISTNWDGWAKAAEARPDQGMLTFVDQYAMTAAEALEAFDRIVRLAPVSQVVVSSGDLQARLDLWIRGFNAARADGAAQPATPALQPRRIRRAYVAPRDALERRVAATWQELLGIDQVGIHDHFLELGGHSLLAIQLLSRLRDTFQVELPLRILFEATTVAEVAQQLRAHEGRPGQVEQIALLLEQIEGMGAGDVRAMLAAKKKARGEI